MKDKLCDYLDHIVLGNEEFGTIGKHTPDRILKVMVDDQKQVGFLIKWRATDSQTPSDSIVLADQLKIHREFMIQALEEVVRTLPSGVSKEREGVKVTGHSYNFELGYSLEMRDKDKVLEDKVGHADPGAE